MTIYNTFDTFDIDDDRLLLFAAEIGEADDRITVEVPITGVFTSPILNNGDTFNLYQALRSVEGLEPDEYNTGVPDFRRWDKRLSVISDLYWESEAITSVRGGRSTYEGNPPRKPLGSYTESINGVYTSFQYINYFRSGIGKRLILLDRLLTEPMWGITYDWDFATGSLDYNFNEALYRNLGGKVLEVPQTDSFHLYLDEGYSYNENEGADPPLPPRYVPQAFRLHGRVYFEFTMAYTYRWPGSDRLVDVTMGSSPLSTYAPYGPGWLGGLPTGTI